MIVGTMIVNDAGDTASSIAPSAPLEAVDVLTGALRTFPATKLSGAAQHACVRVRTLSGCEAVFSNNALVWPEGMGYVLAQVSAAIGARIRTLVDGVAAWEPVVSVERLDDLQDVVPLLVAGGLMAIGTTPTHRIFTTERGNAPPDSRS